MSSTMIWAIADIILYIQYTCVKSLQDMWVDSVFGDIRPPDWLKDVSHRGSVIHVFYQLFVKF
jgi:hypothetical protein